MRFFAFFLLLPSLSCLQSDLSIEDSDVENNQPTLIIDVNIDRFIEGVSDLTESFNARFQKAIAVDHPIDSNGISLDPSETPIIFESLTLSSVNVILHNGHFHLAVRDLSGRFTGTPDLRSVLYTRSVGWSRFVRVNALIGPITVVNSNGLPFVNQHLHCKVDEIEIGEEEWGDTVVDQIVARVLSDRMKRAAKTEHLVLDGVIRSFVESVKLSMILPSDSSLIYSLIDNPTWFNTSSSSSNLLRLRLHSRFHPHLQRDLPLPQMDPLLRMGSLRPLDRHHHRTHSLHPSDSLPLDPLPSPSHSLLQENPSSSEIHAVLQPFDVYYHILDSSFTNSISHLCKKGFFDEVFTVPRGDFNISLELQCEGKPRVDLSDLHESWKMKVGLPLLYIYRNDSSAQTQLVEKILTLSIHHDRLRLSFIVQSAFPQPNELGRFVFSNQIFRHLSSVINHYYTIPLPFVSSVYSTLPFVSAIDNRLVLAVNLTAVS